MIVVEDTMRRLAQRRPVFCSEADFQHELAYELRLGDRSLGVRLEWPISAPQRGAIDVFITGKGLFALELKYLAKGIVTEIDGQPITIKHHGANDQRRYDVCKDVVRMEAFAEQTGQGAAVLVLTNDPSYWQPRKRADTADAAFDLSELRELTGQLHWGENAGPGTTNKREDHLDIKGRYPLIWQDFSDLGGRAGKFRYLWIPVAASVPPEDAIV